MAYNSYRQDYKRRWMAANRLVKRKKNASATAHSCNTTNVPHVPVMSEHVSVSIPPLEIELPNEVELPTATGHLVQHNVPYHSEVDFSFGEVEYMSDSSSSDDDNSLETNLVTWVYRFQINHNAVDSLLKILKQHGNPDLPTTARTLLGTTKIVNTQIKSGMQYYHYPLADVLLNNFLSYPNHVQENVDCLEISLNVDGIPLFKSSSTNMWPVLCGIMNLAPVKIFPVTLTCGESKPSNLDFLNDVIHDLNLILDGGLRHNNRTINVLLRCVVCDAPARAMVKAKKLYSGYNGCDKCDQAGKWVGRLTYPEVNNVQLRTNNTFRNQIDEEHHKAISPFTCLKIDMVKGFPIDYMHQLCLGVMKKLILAWKRGNKEVRLCARQLDEISHGLVNLRSSIPKCFARKPRSLTEVDRWKATEYRQFLLYTGKVVLKGVLSATYYQHFLVLSVASSILISPHLTKVHLNYARDLLKYFVESANQLYGPEFMVYNIHSLMHMADDAETYGSLDQCSGFPFENYLQKLKRFVRSGKNPIAQIVKRLSEENASHQNQFQQTSISFKHPDNGYVSGNSCYQVVHEHDGRDEAGKMFVCRVYNKSEAMFTNPCDSRIVGIHKVSVKSASMKVVSSSILKKQAIVVSIDNYLLFMEILHHIN